MTKHIALGQGRFILGSGLFEDKPAVFIEPAPEPKPVGTRVPEGTFPHNELMPGATVITITDRRGGDMLIEEIQKALAKLPSVAEGEDETGVREALAWYGEQARLARLIHSEGDSGRHALADDGGKRATAALAPQPPKAETPAGVGVVDAMAGYLRVCAAGGMPHELRDQVEAAVKQADRLGYFAALSTAPAAGRSFQARTQDWLDKVTHDDPTDLPERLARFLEESLELVQALGMSLSDAHALVRYVFGREIGDPPQEVGGVTNTLAALCTHTGHNMMECAEAELARVQDPEVIAKVRRKRAGRHGRGPLPGKEA